MITLAIRLWRELVTQVRNRLDDTPTKPEPRTDINYTMPPPYDIDLDPAPPIAELPDYTSTITQEDEGWGTYL